MRDAVTIMMTLAAALPGVTPQSADAQITWDQSRWRIEARESRVERQEGRDALFLQNGTAWLQGSASHLQDGVIDFDMRVSGGLGFHGIAFRAVDGQNYEHFYLRPFVSGNPDASAYTPVFNGNSGWQIYSDARFGLPVTVATDRWIHVELRVRGERAEAYVDGQPLVFPALQRPLTTGGIGLTSSGAGARFANVVVTPGAPELEAGAGADAPADLPGIVRRWRVSTTFAEARLDSTRDLDRALVETLQWDTLATAVLGIADIAKLRTRTAAANTVMAAVTLRSAGAMRARVRFGFSDRAVVYLNGRPIYRGAAAWRSRDYKFLGTIGLHDELILPLNRGDNQLWIAVSEDFGGWGVTLQVLDTSGVQVVP
jgi:hypothetical protein